jgi:hypothetical protein
MTKGIVADLQTILIWPFFARTAAAVNRAGTAGKKHLKSYRTGLKRA